MKTKIFNRSIQLLILAMLVIMAFFRGPHSQWLVIGAVGAWALFILTAFIVTHSKVMKEKISKLIAIRPKGKVKANTFIVPEIADPPEKILLRHVNCRITDKLKSAYPDATWEWCEETPVKLAAKGGTGRIKTSETGEYNYADVTIDQYARIKFNMMKIVSLDDAVTASEGTAAPVKTEAEPVVDVGVWYDLMGRDVLQEIITELNAHGHSYLVIKELGEVCIVDNDGHETKLEELENLPKKKWWSELAKVFCDNGLKTSVEEDRIILSW